METTERKTQGKEFWRAHITASQSYSGTATEYCVMNGLSKSTFQRYKRELGFVRRGRKARRPAFAKVITNSPQPGMPVTQNLMRLPDPKWVAEVLTAMGGVR